VILTQKCFTFASATKVSVLCDRDVIVEICILPFLELVNAPQ